MAQPHKGDRKAQTIRFPTPLMRTIKDAADAAGCNVSDYVVDVLARANEAGLIQSQPRNHHQGHLPISA